MKSLLRIVLLAGVVAVAPSLVRADESVTDGTRTLTVSQSTGLTETGQTITVSGSGYDVSRGIYVALCVATPKGVLPSPCGGGVDMEGDGGASVWISDNPPSYAAGLPRPYGPGGSFRVSFKVGPVIDKFNDCRAVRCAIVTKSDHTINSDRSQDLQIPVTFLGTAPTTTVKSGTSKSTMTTVVASTTTEDVVATEGDVSSTTVVEEVTSTTEEVVEVTVVDNVDDLVLIATKDEVRRWCPPRSLIVGVALILVLVAVLAVRRRR
ncbi:MAG: hypothetical protein ACKOFZ_08065 [Ilumatobacteraceae bacterium]